MEAAMTKDRSYRDMGAFLSKRQVMTLATVDADGRPHAADLYFVCDKALNLYFYSNPQAEHCLHALQRPEVAVTVHARFRSWQRIQGLQMRGWFQAVEPARHRHVNQLYINRYPFLNEIPRFAIDDMTAYVVQPNWLRWINNRVHFGWKLETDWPLDGKLESTHK